MRIKPTSPLAIPTIKSTKPTAFRSMRLVMISTITSTFMLSACQNAPTQNRADNANGTHQKTLPSPPTVLMKEADIVSASPSYGATPAMNKRMSVMPPMPYPQPSAQNNERYQDLKENTVKRTSDDAVSTLSIDVDTGSYANMRRFLNNGKLPPKDAIRIEELLNYFKYDFKKPSGSAAKHPFAVSTELAESPWNANNHILRVGVKAVDVNASEQPPANLVFLVDVSGSMRSKDKLELAKSSLKLLTKNLRKQDTVSMVVYAGRTQVELPATAGNKTSTILSAIDRLTAGGSTNGEAALKLAYNEAAQHFKKDGINRILLMTDGDFNVGMSSNKDIIDMVEQQRKRGISLSTLGFGTGNYNEHMMEQIANKGNGNYSYIDSLSEAQKVFGEEMAETFNTVAKDVKLQLEFNPATVKEWRLIGYENRVLAEQDFNNDNVDAAEIGAGKSVVALYEITPVGKQGLYADRRYETTKPTDKANELGYLKVRYKQPNGDKSTLFSLPITKTAHTANSTSNDMQFAMAVAGFGQILKNSDYRGTFTYDDVIKLAKKGKGQDEGGYRAGFVKLVKLADGLDHTPATK